MIGLSNIPDLAKYTIGGAAVVALVVGVALWINQGSHVRLDGRIVKVRVIQTGDDSAVALAELRVRNPASIVFTVRNVRMSLTRQDGSTLDGLVASQADIDRVLQYYPESGPRYNDVLRARTQVGPGRDGDWCVGASFALPAAAVNARKGVTVEVEDVDGAVVRLLEANAK